MAELNIGILGDISLTNILTAGLEISPIGSVELTAITSMDLSALTGITLDSLTTVDITALLGVTIDASLFLDMSGLLVDIAGDVSVSIKSGASMIMVTPISIIMQSVCQLLLFIIKTMT